jgi:hypothetical protein
MPGNPVYFGDGEYSSLANAWNIRLSRKDRDRSPWTTIEIRFKGSIPCFFWFSIVDNVVDSTGDVENLHFS